MKPGTLVQPSIGKVYLTPVDSDIAEDTENWIEWEFKQFGIVLEQNNWVTIFTESGIGYCFLDEVKIIYDV